MNPLQITSEFELRDWLEDKPISWIQMISVRAALRAVPAIGIVTQGILLSDDQYEELVISVIRANFVALAAVTYPIRTVSDAAYSATAAYDNYSDGVKIHTAAEIAASNAGDAAAYAADAAAHIIGYAASPIVDAAADAVAAASNAIDFFNTNTPTLVTDNFTADHSLWRAVSSDAQWLDSALSQYQAGDLIEVSLWHGKAPIGARALWHSFTVSEFAARHGFRPWIQWYDALASLDGTSPPLNIFSNALTLRIATQPGEWWERPAKLINADVTEWLSELPSTSNDIRLQTDIQHALKNLPPQQPAPYLFDWRDGRMEVLPPDALPEDGGIAQDYLDEARDKASDLSERLNGRNFDPNIRRKVGKLLEALKERVADLRPAIVDSRTISVERLASALDNPQDAAELPSDILADLGDLADTARRLCNCLPALWRKDVERLADSLTADSAAALLTQLDAMREGIKEAEIVGPEVHAAFATLSEESAEPAANDVKRWRIAMFGLTARNFLTALLKHGTDSAAVVGSELLRLIRDVRRELRPELVKGIAKLLVGGVVTTAAACLFVALLEPASAIAKLFPEIERVVRILESAKPGSGEPPAPPQSPPSAPGPRPSRPKSDRDPTRPA